MRLCQAKSQLPNPITRELLGSLGIVFCPLLCVAEIQRLLAVYAHLIPRVTCPPSLVRARVFCPLFCHWPRVKTTRSPYLSPPSGRVSSEIRACIFPALLCVAEMTHHSQSTGWQVSRPGYITQQRCLLKFETSNNQWFLWPTLPWWPVTCSRELTWLENESSSRYCFRQGLKYPVNKRNRNTDSWIKSEPCHTQQTLYQ